MIPHLDLSISHFELWVASIIRLVPFNSRAPVVTDLLLKIAKSQLFEIYHFFFSQYFLDVKP